MTSSPLVCGRALQLLQGYVEIWERHQGAIIFVTAIVMSFLLTRSEHDDDRHFGFPPNQSLGPFYRLPHSILVLFDNRETGKTAYWDPVSECICWCTKKLCMPGHPHFVIARKLSIVIPRHLISHIFRFSHLAQFLYTILQ
jgi:hypothetical protein